MLNELYKRFIEWLHLNSHTIRKLDALEVKLDRILHILETNMDLSKLEAQVDKNVATDDAAVAFIDTLKNNDNQAAIDAVVDRLTASEAKVRAAIAAPEQP